MNGDEQALVFGAAGQRLVGVLHCPTQAAELAVLVLVGGPQYRVGSHRQFVLLARALAAAGVPVLRFDYRGMGDSEGDMRTFDHVSDDIQAAISALLAAQPEVRRVVLWGLCDAASAALLYVHDRPDPRVAGLVLVNPWARSAASLAKVHVKHYYRQRFKEPAFWAKLLRGHIAVAAVSDLLRNLAAAFGRQSIASSIHMPYQERMARGWASFKGPLLLMLSQHDLTAREFVEYCASSSGWRQALAARAPTRVELVGADHTCSQPAAQRALEEHTLQWLGNALLGC